MKKKKQLLIGLAFVGVAATSSVATVAAAKHLPWTVNIYSVSTPEDSQTTVSTFDDRGNKCYVVVSKPYSSTKTDAASISCVRMQ